MKLLRCYIENFGALHKFEMNFKDGITVIKAPNGFGKTTFAAFIRAMLYGLPRGNKNSLEKDFRRKYNPWQGGKFGGCMEFELEGAQYRVERFFGDKPARDSFALYELPEIRPSRRFSENLGVELFGLDAESFERSTCMAQLSETGNLSTDAIRAKLGNLVEDTGDVNNYEKAVAGLRRARTKLMPYRGSGGDVYNASEKITELQTSLSEHERAGKVLPALCGEISLLEKELEDTKHRMEELRRSLMSASEQAARQIMWERKNELVRRRDALAEELDALSAAYPNGVPSETEISEANAAMDRLAALENTAMETKAAEILEKKSSSAAVAENTEKSGALVPLLIVAGLFAAAGIVVFALKQFALGGVLLSCGLLSATAALYFNFRRIADRIEQREKRSAAQPLDDEVETLLNEYARLQESSEYEKKECLCALEDFFEEYAPFMSSSRESLARIRSDALRFEGLCAEFAAAENELKRFAAEHPEIGETAPCPEAYTESMKHEYEGCARRLSELDRSLAEKRREADAAREKAEKIPEIADAVEHWKRVRSRGMEKCGELDAAIEYLGRAREKLSESYLDRIKAGFAKYLNCLTENETERIYVDSDLSVKLERGGEARTLEYFSAGFSDIVMLCMRLALIDALFREEKPFVIMDDPLVNLDDAHTKKALELINRLGRERQVIYLVCNSSRC